MQFSELLANINIQVHTEYAKRKAGTNDIVDFRQCKQESSEPLNFKTLICIIYFYLINHIIHSVQTCNVQINRLASTESPYNNSSHKYKDQTE